MGYFSGDNTNTADGSTGPVYVRLGDAGSLAAIYPLRASGTVQCKYCGAPVESGAKQMDHKIYMPTQVTIHGVVKPEHYHLLHKVNDEIYQRKVITGEAYIKAGYFPNMMVESLKMDDSNERLDGTEVVLTLVEMMEANTKVKNGK